MRKTLLVSLTLALVIVPAHVEAQVRGGRAGGRANLPPRAQVQAENRRANLERQVLQRFVEQSGREMGLTAATQTELGRILDASVDQRRALTVESGQLRQKLSEALRNDRTTDNQFRDILKEIDDLREREHSLWKKEQDGLSKTLSPRQQAQFVVRWLRLQDNIRGLIDQRGGLPNGGLMPMQEGPPPRGTGGASDIMTGGA